VQRLSGPAELVQAVPYLVGFHPADSLVLAGLDGARVVVTARLDLGDAQLGAAAHTLATLARAGCTSVIGVVYDDDATAPPAGGPAQLPWRELAEDLLADGAALGCAVLDVLLVSRGRWWSFSCESARCCPAEGQEVPTAPSAFTAAATYTGMVALPDRAALEAELAPLPDESRAALADAIAAAEHAAIRQTVAGEGARYERAVTRAIFAAARRSDEPKWPGSDEGSVAEFGAALAVIPIRDAVWLAIDHRRLDGRPLWRELARRLPAPYDVAPLFLFGWASWRAGNGALANIAADRVLRADPGYTAADLLLTALLRGVDPRTMPRLGRSA
jgi:hypothetical protein